MTSAQGTAGKSAAAEPLIGVINAGSSSVKFSFYEGERTNPRRAGRRDRSAPFGERHRARRRKDRTSRSRGEAAEPCRAKYCRRYSRGPERSSANRRLAALGHRVVHGGMHYSEPARVTPELLAELEALVPLAPLHEPYNLAPDQDGDAAQSRIAASGLLRHRLSPHRAGGRPGLCAALFVL